VAETGVTYVENARIKAINLMEITGKPALGDDGGLELISFPELLGVKTARYFPPNLTDREMNERLIELMKGKKAEERQATLHCVLVYVREDYSEIVVEQSLTCYITQRITGKAGYGFDELLYLPEVRQTLAQLSTEKRRELSPRVRGIRQMVRKLN